MLRDRDLVYRAVDSEREYQDNVWPERTCAGVRSIGEEILCMEVCLADARRTWMHGDDFDATDKTAMLKEIRKVVAVGVRCLEKHGAPERV